MKKLLSITLMSSSLFIFSGCGSSSSTPISQAPVIIVTPPDTILPIDPDEPIVYPEEPIIYPDEPIDFDILYSIDITDLDDGYSLEGYNDNGELVILEYCHGRYNYYRGSDYFYGDFDTNELTINMYDNDGGSYIIDTDAGLIDVGVNYYIFDINSDITVDIIAPLNDCY